MQITVTNSTGDLFPIDVPEDLEVGDFKALCEAETGIPIDEIELMVIHLSVFYFNNFWKSGFTWYYFYDMKVKL
jgi:hypothetical protein